MAWIETLDESEAQNLPAGELSALYAEMLDPTSRKVDNILKIHSLHPRGLQAHFDLYRAVMAGTRGLRKADREMIAVVVSLLNDCGY